MAGSVQISSSVFQLNFSAKLKVSAPKSATTQSRQTLAVSVANRKNRQTNQQKTEIKIVNLRLNELI
jgi:hypothetical protein